MYGLTSNKDWEKYYRAELREALANGRKEVTLWGIYTIIANGNDYTIKSIDTISYYATKTVKTLDEVAKYLANGKWQLPK